MGTAEQRLTGAQIIAEYLVRAGVTHAAPMTMARAVREVGRPVYDEQLAGRAEEQHQ